jgi:hypothetical protein
LKSSLSSIVTFLYLLYARWAVLSTLFSVLKGETTTTEILLSYLFRIKLAPRAGINLTLTTQEDSSDYDTEFRESV